MNDFKIYSGKLPEGTKPEDSHKVGMQMISEMEESNNRPSKGNKYVLFLDILGFKDLIEKNPVQKVEAIYKHQVIETMGLALQTSFASYNIPYMMQQVLDGNTLLDSVHNQFNVHIMSDSIIIWTNDDLPASLYKICAFTTSFLSLCLIMGVPLRGGISKGYISEMKTSANATLQSCIVGTGIVNAYQLEGKQNWMGCLVDKKCIAELESHVLDKIHSPKDITSIIKYDVPLKGNQTSEEYVINWVHTAQRHIIKDNIEYFNDCFSRFNKSIEHDSVRDKIRNSLDFYKTINKL